MTSESLQLLPHRSNERLAELVATSVLPKLGEVGSVLDIGCGDGKVGEVIPETWRYRGIDLSNASIYAQNNKDSRIKYADPEKLDRNIADCEPADVILLLDVLEHTRKFHELLEVSTKLAPKYIVISLPNELFFLDRINFLLGKEQPAHSLDLLGLPEGFKHQYIININKAKRILKDVAHENNFGLIQEWHRPLITKNRLYSPLLWLMRKVSSEQVWSMGTIFVFKRKG